MKTLIVLLGALVMPFLGGDYLTNLLIVVMLHALPAIGVSLLMGYTGQISLGARRILRSRRLRGGGVQRAHGAQSLDQHRARRGPCRRDVLVPRVGDLPPTRSLSRGGDPGVWLHRQHRFRRIAGLDRRPQRAARHPTSRDLRYLLPHRPDLLLHRLDRPVPHRAHGTKFGEGADRSDHAGHRRK